MLPIDQEQNALFRYSFGYFPALLLLLALFFAISYLVSIYFLVSPRTNLDQWSCTGIVGDKKTWNIELKKLETAKKLDPWNADIYMDLGRMYEWKALSGKAWNTKTKEARKKASHYFKQATIHRPTWALAWASFAQSQMLNRVVDEEVLTALSNGLTYGRWQLETQQKLLWLTVGIWKKLPDDLKNQVKHNISAMADRKGAIQMLTQIAVRFDWLNELIPLINNRKNRDYLELIENTPQMKKNILTGSSKKQEFFCSVV